MRTVHTYTPVQQQEQQQPPPPPPPSSTQHQQPTANTASSTSTTNLHPHSSMSGYPSVRHSLLRMHSQLRSGAANRRESSQGGPIDLSLYRTSQSTPKMMTRSTSTSNANTAFRPICIIPPVGNTTTHTIYSNAVPSSTSTSSASSQSSTCTNNHERPTKFQHSMSIPDDRKSHARPAPSLSPKLAYSYSNIEENLQCPLCLDRLRDPRALPCQHVFCCSCLKSIPSSNGPFPTIVCPLCRRTFPYNSADQFPVSYIHRQLLELIPKNYDVNGKCTKCQDKTSLTLCSCCDFLLCQKCFSNDRQKILDNIEHITQTCRFRVKRIDMTYNQILKLNQSNQRIIDQVQNAYENFERKYTEHKQTILHQLHQHNDDINRMFWSKLNLPITSTTESFTQILDQADLIMQKSQTVQFEDILNLFYNLTSINEQLEQANTSIDTPKIQNLLKQDMQINYDEQLSVQLNPNNPMEKILPLIPPTILPRTIKRLRKTEPKRHIEQIDDDDDDDDDHDHENHDDCVFEDSTCLSKRMKSEYEEENLISPISSIFSSNIETQGNEINDDDIIFMGSYQIKSPVTPNLEELLQIINTNE